jgi:hypothetical protein
MPRPEPPTSPHARRRAVSAPSGRRGASLPGRRAVGPAQHTAPSALPGGWAFGGTAPPAELNTLWLNTDLLGQRESLPAAESFAPLHARASQPAPSRAQVTFTKLDAKGRLPVPLCPVIEGELVAERDGDVLRVFLPGAATAPRAGYDTPPLRVDARRRLLLGRPLRNQLGLPDNATVITRVDTEETVLELMAASRIEPQLDQLFDAHRREAPATPGPVADGTRRLTALPGGRLTPSPVAASSTPPRTEEGA